MKTIHKYPIEGVDRQSVELPWGAKFRHVDSQPLVWMPNVPNLREGMYLWAEVDTAETRIEKWVLRVAGTGHNMDDVPDFAIFLGTIKQYNGGLMFHIYAWKAKP